MRDVSRRRGRKRRAPAADPLALPLPDGPRYGAYPRLPLAVRLLTGRATRRHRYGELAGRVVTFDGNLCIGKSELAAVSRRR